jgi:hypothetical protein
MSLCIEHTVTGQVLHGLAAQKASRSAVTIGRINAAKQTTPAHVTCASCEADLRSMSSSSALREMVQLGIHDDGMPAASRNGEDRRSRYVRSLDDLRCTVSAIPSWC